MLWQNNLTVIKHIFFGFIILVFQYILFSSLHVSWFHQNKMYLSHFFHCQHCGYLHFRLIPISADSAVGLNTLISLLLYCNTYYSRWLPRTCNVDNICSSSFESLHPSISFHLVYIVTTRLECYVSYIWLVFTPSVQNFDHRSLFKGLWEVTGSEWRKVHFVCIHNFLFSFASIIFYVNSNWLYFCTFL